MTHQNANLPSYTEIFEQNDMCHRKQMHILKLANKYGMSSTYAYRLKCLDDFRIAFILDDSGSMNTHLEEPTILSAASNTPVTRWKELEALVKIFLEICLLFDKECSIHFLNGSTVENINSPSEIESHFQRQPIGLTPIPMVLDQVLNKYSYADDDKNVLIVIVTDGEPTDDIGNVAIDKFQHLLKLRKPHVYTSIVACTDDEESIKYLTGWNNELANLDVTSSYRRTCEEVESQLPFSIGDYIVKLLIGSIDTELFTAKKQVEETHLIERSRPATLKHKSWVKKISRTLSYK